MFSTIRGSLGSNNNPTVTHFRAAYKKILLGASHRARKNLDHFSLSIFDVKVDKTDDIVLKNELKWIDLYLDCEDSNEYCQDILPYISGYIQKRVLYKETCLQCYNFLQKLQKNIIFFS